MNTYFGIQEINDNRNSILTLGMFDGVHKGHQKIISRLNKIAAQKNGQSTLLSFSPHPRLVLQKDSDLKLLTLQEEKIAKLEQFGLENLVIHPFDIDFSRKTSLQFVRDYLVNTMGLHTLVIGHDHHFGRNREGNFEQLSEYAALYHFELLQLEAILGNEQPISSTKIRNALLSGDLAYAHQTLGYHYTLCGKVIHGDGIGKTIGSPTANLQVHPLKLIPKNGVYAVKTKIEQQTYWGLMNIGTRPTLADNQKRIEVYLIDFCGDLYQQEICVELRFRLRDELKFENIEALKKQIQKDEKQLRSFLNA